MKKENCKIGSLVRLIERPYAMGICVEPDADLSLGDDGIMVFWFDLLNKEDVSFESIELLA